VGAGGSAQPLRQKPGLDLETDSQGRPRVAERVYVIPPGSQLGPPPRRPPHQTRRAGSGVAGASAKTQKHDSACEKLKPRAAQAPPATSSGDGGATDKTTGGVMGGWATSCSAPPARAAVAARAG